MRPTISVYRNFREIHPIPPAALLRHKLLQTIRILRVRRPIEILRKKKLAPSIFTIKVTKRTFENL